MVLRTVLQLFGPPSQVVCVHGYSVRTLLLDLDRMVPTRTQHASKEIMSIQSIIQGAASVLNVVVLAVGYYFLVKLYREWVSQRREEHTAGRRPQVIVAAVYSHLPQVHLVVRNFTKAPAKDFTFEFSAPVEDSSGFVLSDLPYLKQGLPFLEPEAYISCRWDTLPSLARLFRERELEDGIKVATKYKDLAEEDYESQWTLRPLLFEGAPIETSLGMNDLVNAVQKIPEGIAGRHRGRVAESGEKSRGEPT